MPCLTLRLGGGGGRIPASSPKPTTRGPRPGWHLSLTPVAASSAWIRKVRPMAKPDLDEGYLRYAHTLDAALAYADFGKAERVVLRHVFAQVFGPAERRWARLRPG